MGSNIYDNRRSIESTRQQPKAVEQYQLDADARLGRIEKSTSESIVRVETVTRTVETVAERNGRSKAGLVESERIITESKSILQDIRKQKQAVTN